MKQMKNGWVKGSAEEFLNGQPVDRLPPSMTREQAVLKAREVFGEMGTISAFEEPGFRCMVWKIGEIETTIGRGHTWESAFRNSEWRRAKFAKRGIKK